MDESNKSYSRFKNYSQAILITDLSNAIPQENLDSKNKKGKWRVINYETASQKGNMVFASADANPGIISIPLNVKGWHAIYLSMPGGIFFGNDIKCKLSSDKYWFPISSGPHPHNAVNYHMFEGFWKCADLTDEELEVCRGYDNSALSYIRLIPLTAGEIIALKKDRDQKETKKLIAVHDAEFWYRGHNEKPGREEILSEIRGHLEVMKDTDFAVVIPQVDQLFSQIPSFKHIEYPGDKSEIIPCTYRKCVNDSNNMRDSGICWLGEYVEYAHEIGLKVWVGLRGTSISPPPVDEIWTSEFALNHPEFHCRDREGNPIFYLSWFFPEVRNRIFQELGELISFGVDGVGLSLVRSGPFTLYEEPAVKRFMEDYGYDPRECPENDENWMNFKAGLLTGYMQEIRELLNKQAEESGRGRLSFFVEVSGREEVNRLFGYDLEAWVSKEIIDTIIVKDQVFCPGTEDYAGKSNDFRAPEVAVDYSYIQRVMKCSAGCKLYHDLMPRIMPPDEYRQKAKKAYSNGCTGLAFWDGPLSRIHLNQWEVVRRLGHPDELERAGESHFEPITAFNGKRIDRYPIWWTW